VHLFAEGILTERGIGSGGAVVRDNLSRITGGALLVTALALLIFSPPGFNIIHFYFFLACFVCGILLIMGFIGTHPSAARIRRTWGQTAALRRAPPGQVSEKLFPYATSPLKAKAATAICFAIGLGSIGLGVLIARQYPGKTAESLLAGSPLCASGILCLWIGICYPGRYIQVKPEGITIRGYFRTATLPWQSVRVLIAREHFVLTIGGFFSTGILYSIYSDCQKVSFSSQIAGSERLVSLVADATGLAWNPPSPSQTSDSLLVHTKPQTRDFPKGRSRIVKVFLIIVLALIVIVAIIVAAVFYFTSDVTRTGDRFFSLIRDGNVTEAYQSTSKEFQAATSEDQFKAFLKISTIGDYESASWTSRSISNNTGELQGSLKTKGGGVVPIKVKLVNENRQWKVLAIEKTPAGIVTDSGAAVVPAEDTLISMANTSNLQLGRAVNADDFGAFYSSISKTWQGQTTPDALKEIFKSFIDQKIDLTILEGKKPEFIEKATIDESGRLILKGFYPLTTAKVNFTLKYIREDQQWKLIGIRVQQEPTPEKNN
jgi:hypothetical protein